MKLTETNYSKIINTFSPSDWNPLLELIPEIEKSTKFGEMKGGEKTQDGTINMPYWHESALVSRFQETAYELPIIINYNWNAWEAGRKMIDDADFNYDSIDIPTKCKLITLIIRSNRFFDGALISAFESGLILKLLKSIKRQVKSE
ncbi:MAG: DUF6508 domain-containing protein [Bacteroidota bacterium]|nr:DUF6508 domain-containing protein [Bacteroidota bacterium]